MRVVTARLLHVHVLSRLHREDRRGRVPVVRRRDHQRVHLLVVQRPSKVRDLFERFLLHLFQLERRLGEDVRIDVGEIRHLGVRGAREGAREDGPTPIQSHHRDANPLGG